MHNSFYISENNSMCLSTQSYDTSVVTLVDICMHDAVWVGSQSRNPLFRIKSDKKQRICIAYNITVILTRLDLSRGKNPVINIKSTKWNKINGLCDLSGKRFGGAFVFLFYSEIDPTC